MSYNVITLHPFDRQAKRLMKRYPSLKTELSSLIKSLRETPNQGTPLGENCYKVRLSIASKTKGKSGGARVITHLYISASTVFLLAIYDKGEQVNISDKVIKDLLKLISR